MPGMGVGCETKVERRMPMGEGVMVILMESSMSSDLDQRAFKVLAGGIGVRIPDITIQPSGAAK